MVALQSPRIVTIPIRDVLLHPKRVDPESDVVMTARATGISFGTLRRQSHASTIPVRLVPGGTGRNPGRPLRSWANGSISVKNA